MQKLMGSSRIWTGIINRFPGEAVTIAGVCQPRIAGYIGLL